MLAKSQQLETKKMTYKNVGHFYFAYFQEIASELTRIEPVPTLELI